MDPARAALRAAAAAAALAAAGCGHAPVRLGWSQALTAEEHVRLGAAYEAQGLEEAAERQYRDALRRDPDSARARLALGNLQFRRGDLGGAESAFKRVLKARPDDAAAMNNLAMVRLSRGDARAAERLARQSLAAAAPGLRPYVLETLAQALLRQGRRDEALAAVGEAESAGPPDAALVAQLALTRRAANLPPSGP